MKREVSKFADLSKDHHRFASGSSNRSRKLRVSLQRKVDLVVFKFIGLR